VARESFRLNQYELPAVDVTITARDAARLAPASALRASLAKHWKNIARQG
jgi:RNase P protein component